MSETKTNEFLLTFSLSLYTSNDTGALYHIL